MAIRRKEASKQETLPAYQRLALRCTFPEGVKNPKIRQKIYKNYIFEVFQNYQKNTQKLHLPFCCFQNYQKNMQKLHKKYKLRRFAAQLVLKM